MSPTHHYKRFETKILGRISATFGAIFKGLSRFISSAFTNGKQRYTIMFIPHSEKKIFSIHLNVFTMAFFGFLLGAVCVAFFVMVTDFAANSRVIENQGERLEAARTNLELVRDELSQLRKSAASFQETLKTTLSVLSLRVQDDADMERQEGDLAAVENLAMLEANKPQEIYEIRLIRKMLADAMVPLSEIYGVLAAQKNLLQDIPTMWPLKGVRGFITTNFGPAEHPFTHQWYLHKGLDIAYGYGVPIVSSASGKVMVVDYEPLGLGNYILIRHKYGFYTKYAHLQQMYVSRGEEVGQGQILGTMGSTGLSTGPHLHYEVRIGSEVVDPAKYLNLANALAGD